ncbi:hypothetical protein BDR04DRAFT_1150962 [Suillus decipiens]|nr:hypothetical protein BDR04DRAFT_1150962 [Suillus decipiens]
MPENYSCLLDDSFPSERDGSPNSNMSESIRDPESPWAPAGQRLLRFLLPPSPPDAPKETPDHFRAHTSEYTFTSLRPESERDVRGATKYEYVSGEGLVRDAPRSSWTVNRKQFQLRLACATTSNGSQGLTPTRRTRPSAGV